MDIYMLPTFDNEGIHHKLYAGEPIGQPESWLGEKIHELDKYVTVVQPYSIDLYNEVLNTQEKINVTYASSISKLEGKNMFRDIVDDDRDLNKFTTQFKGLYAGFFTCVDIAATIAVSCAEGLSILGPLGVAIGATIAGTATYETYRGYQAMKGAEKAKDKATFSQNDVLSEIETLITDAHTNGSEVNDVYAAAADIAHDNGLDVVEQFYRKSE